MKSLLYVVKILLQINGAIALVSLLTIIALRQQKVGIVAQSPQLAQSSQNFHRSVQQLPSEHQQQIKAHQQQIEKLKQEKNREITALKARLADYQKAQQSSTVVSHQSASSTQTASATNPVTETPTQPTRPIRIAPPANSEAVTSVRHQPQSTQQANSAPYQIDHSTTINPSNSSTSRVGDLQRSIMTHRRATWTTHTPHSSTAPANQEDPINVFQMYQVTQFIAALDSADDRQPSPQARQAVILAPKAKTPLEDSVRLANDLAAGLLVAQRERQINRGTSTYNKVQTAIGSLRKGTSHDLKEAANLAQLEFSVLKKVAKWGEERPGRSQPYQVSLAPR